MKNNNDIQPTGRVVLERLTAVANSSQKSLNTLVKQYMQERFLYKLSLLPDCRCKLGLQEYTLAEIKGAYLGDSTNRFFRGLNFGWQERPSDKMAQSVEKIIKKICTCCDDCITHPTKYLAPVNWEENSVQVSYMHDYLLAVRVTLTARLDTCVQELTFYVEPAWQKHKDIPKRQYVLAKYPKHRLPVIETLTVNSTTGFVSLWPELSVYPLEYVVANKYYALFYMPTICLKDVYDICIIQKHYDLDKQVLQHAIFQVFDLNWQKPTGNVGKKLSITQQDWEQFLQKNSLGGVPIDIAEVRTQINTITVS